MSSNSPLIDRINKNFSKYATELCLEVEGSTYTYADLDSKSRSFAGWLGDVHGIKAGALVGLWCPEPQPEFFIAMLALLRMGAVFVPLNPTYPQDQIRQIVESAGMEQILVGRGDAPPVDGPRLIDLGAATESEADALANPAEGDLSALLFTSGSTGISKGVMLSHKALGLNVISTAEALGLTAKDRWLFNTPFTFTSAICHFLTCVAAGCSVKAMDRFFFPNDIIATVNSFGATGFGGSPLQIRWLVEAVESPDQMPTLIKLMSSGDSMPEHTIEMIAQTLPNAEFFYVYGMTELGGRFCICPSKDSLNKLGSVGKPLKGLACHIRDMDSAEILPVGEIGEIIATGDMLMDGYWRLPDKTAETISQYGLHSGDLGYLDDDGFLFLSGRKDDVFKSSGEKVSTKAIENALLAYGGFKDVAVVGVPDPYLSMVPKVYYNMLPGNEFNRKKVLAYLRSRLTESHMPSQFVERQDIPRTGSGKIDRKKL